MLHADPVQGLSEDFGRSRHVDQLWREFGPCNRTRIGHGVKENSLPKLLILWYLVQAAKDETDPTQRLTTVLAGADEFARGRFVHV